MSGRHVVATPERARDGAWLLNVRCPFCAKLHTHGGGNGDAPYGGHRVAHCTDTGLRRAGLSREDTRGGYTLEVKGQ